MVMDKQQEIEMKKLTEILDEVRGGIILCNLDTSSKTSRVIYANRGWEEITGYTMEQLTAEKDGNPHALVLEEDKDSINEKYTQQLQLGCTYELLYRITHRSGGLRWVIDKGTSTVLPNGIIKNMSTITEITQIKEHEEQMTLLAQTDQLTGLHNKATFTLLAQTALTRRGKSRYALLMIDIDSFKSINDTSGHAFGDKVLAAVAQQMKSFFRSSDILGRVGGDEFMVLITDVADVQAVEKKARKLCTSISSIKIPKHRHNPITVSVGISFLVGDKPFEAMFSEADTALYRAKGQGKNQCQIVEIESADGELYNK